MARGITDEKSTPASPPSKSNPPPARLPGWPKAVRAALIRHIEAGTTAAELARLTELAPSGLSQFKRTGEGLSPSALEQLARVLDRMPD